MSSHAPSDINDIIANSANNGLATLISSLPPLSPEVEAYLRAAGEIMASYVSIEKVWAITHENRVVGSLTWALMVDGGGEYCVRRSVLPAVAGASPASAVVARFSGPRQLRNNTPSTEARRLAEIALGLRRADHNL